MMDVLVVGQTPPPVNGQTVMIKGFLEGEYERIRLHHVRMTFSRTIDEVGTFQSRKVWLLFTTWVEIVVGRWKSGAKVLYFPPAGPTLIPVIRDMFLLLASRWMFRHTVFHFHAAGLTEIYPRLPWFLKPMFNLAYRNADVAIFTAKSRSSIGTELRAKTIVPVPYGIADATEGRPLARSAASDAVPLILFMGILCEGKGLITLIDACALLHKAGTPFRVLCGGTWDAGTSQEEVEALVANHGMSEVFQFPGVLLGEAKWNAFRAADIFCFPSHYFAESSPVVLTEAMSFQLPIVTTNWRGIPDVVGESGGAFIVEPRSPELVAEALRKLLLDRELRIEMGKVNRSWFLEHGTIEKYRRNMELAILSAEGFVSVESNRTPATESLSGTQASIRIDD